MPNDSNNRNMMRGSEPFLAACDPNQAAQPPEVDYLNFSRIWDVFCRRKWLMLIVFLLVVIPGVLYTKSQKRIWEATAMMVVPTARPMTSSAEDLGLLTDLVELAKSRSVIGITQVLKSNDLIWGASQKLGADGLLKGYGTKAAAEGMVPDWALSFDMQKDSDVITVVGKAYDPDVAATLANTVILNYIDHEKGYTWRTAKQGREFVSKELESVREKLTTAQKNLANFTRKTKLVSADEQIRQLAINTVALQVDRDKAAVEMASTKCQTEVLRSQLDSEGVEIQSSRSMQMSPEYQLAVSDLARLNAERAKLIQEYQPDSIEVKKINDEIDATKMHMKTIVETVVSSTVRGRNPALESYLQSVVNSAADETQIRELTRVMNERNKEMQTLPDRARLYADLNRTVRTLEATFDSLSSKYYAMLINENSTLPNALFAATARPPIEPSTPNKKRNAVLFLLLGMILSVASAILAERFDERVRYEDTVSSITGRIPLGIIPEAKAIGGRSRFQLDGIDPGSPFTEAFRLLHNTIRFSETASQSKILAITSASRDEGKSTVVVNLAAAMAMTGVKVIIVDCNLRNPSLREATEVTHNLGFADLVNKGLTLQEEAIFPTKLENLYCLPSGNLPNNPSEVLDSIESRYLFASLSKAYDVVILDCPAFVGLSDMQIISTLVDGVILVVSVNQTKTWELRDALSGLSRIGAPIIGSVFNRVVSDKVGFNYYGHTEGLLAARSGILGWLKRRRATSKTSRDDES